MMLTGGHSIKMVTAYVIEGLGIGCQNEVAHAFEKAGAKALKVHYRQLLSEDVSMFDSQIINFSGGFLHGDMMGAAMCAANELERAAGFGEDEKKKFKDLLWEYAERGNVIYGQCNGFQVLVKTGLLPAVDNDYSKQTVTLTGNDCGNYRVDFVHHKIERPHFAFEGIDESDLYLWCRHGEGKVQFWSKYGSVSEEEGEEMRRRVNERHVLLRYAHPEMGELTEEFPWNPNGSVDGIAGLVNSNGNIFAHMAHTEVSVYASRDPRWFKWKDELRRQGHRPDEYWDEERLRGIGLKIFRNIVEYFE